MSNVSVFAVVVTYNPNVDLLKKMINSLSNQVSGIVIVDNASINITEVKGCILEIYPSTIFILNEQNMGLGFAHNAGARKSISVGASHVLILDQDSIPDHDCIANLVQTEKDLLLKGVRVAAVGPVYYSEKTGEVYPITKFRGPFIDRIDPKDVAVEASFLISSGCLIRIEMFDKVGFMDEDLFIDYIDVEWSFRAAFKGYKLIATPSARMKHSIGDERKVVMGRSISVHSPLRRYYLSRNSIYMIKKSYIPFGYKLRESVFNTLRLVIFVLLSKDKGEYFKYSIRGILDGVKGVKGRFPHKYS